MPQTTDEMRAKWPGGDRQAMDHLEAKGFKITPDWMWIKPYKNYDLSLRDTSAIQYLIEEWDFGGLADHDLAPDESVYVHHVHTPQLQYILGLLSEEAGEIVKQAAGKSFRFGFDSPAQMKDGEPDFSTTPEAKLHHEAGDMLAAIEMAFRYGILERKRVMQAKIDKIMVLISGRDNMGRPLAPPLPLLPIHGPDGAIWEPEGVSEREVIGFAKGADGKYDHVQVLRITLPDPNIERKVTEKNWRRLFNWMRRSKVQDIPDF